MIQTIKPYVGALTTALATADTHLPLPATDLARLVTEIGEGNHTYLTITSRSNIEYVKATVMMGVIFLERGQESNTYAHPRGSCVTNEMNAPMVKDLICNYECCDGECPCEPVQLTGYLAPIGHVGTQYAASVIFSGSLPMVLSISPQAPSWLTSTITNNALMLSGIPDVAGVYDITVSASNCAGQSTAAVVSIIIDA